MKLARLGLSIASFISDLGYLCVFILLFMSISVQAQMSDLPNYQRYFEPKFYENVDETDRRQFENWLELVSRVASDGDEQTASVVKAFPMLGDYDPLSKRDTSVLNEMFLNVDPRTASETARVLFWQLEQAPSQNYGAMFKDVHRTLLDHSRNGDNQFRTEKEMMDAWVKGVVVVNASLVPDDVREMLDIPPSRNFCLWPFCGPPWFWWFNEQKMQ